MKKVEIRERLQKLVNKVWNEKWEDETLKEMQTLCEQYGDGHMWCSWEECLKEIIKAGNSGAITRAFSLYNKHIKIEAQADAVDDLFEIINRI